MSGLSFARIAHLNQRPPIQFEPRRIEKREVIFFPSLFAQRPLNTVPSRSNVLFEAGGTFLSVPISLCFTSQTSEQSGDHRIRPKRRDQSTISLCNSFVSLQSLSRPPNKKHIVVVFVRNCPNVADRASFFLEDHFSELRLADRTSSQSGSNSSSR